MTYLSAILQPFFSTYAHTQRNLSVNTITAYRDTWRLLIRHLAATTGTSPDRLRLEDLDRQTVVGFLDHLDTTRHNTPATRNTRLTAIRAVLRQALEDGKPGYNVFPLKKEHIA